MTGFLPASAFKEKAYWISAIVGLLVSAALLFGSGYFLLAKKIIVRHMAEINFLPVVPPDVNIKPISEWVNAINGDVKNQILYGYFIDLKSYCASGATNLPLKTAIVISPTMTETTAGEIQWRPAICEKIKTSRSNSAVYLASDHPFLDVPSVMKYIRITK